MFLALAKGKQHQCLIVEQLSHMETMNLEMWVQVSALRLYLSLLGKEPLMSFSLNPMSLDSFLCQSSGAAGAFESLLHFPICLVSVLPTGCPECRMQRWAQGGNSVASVCSRWWALLICPWGPKTIVFAQEPSPSGTSAPQVETNTPPLCPVACLPSQSISKPF